MMRAMLSTFLQVNKLHLIKYPECCVNGIDWEKPDQSEILIGNKTHIFFSDSGCCKPKSEQFLSRTSNLPKEKQELFSQRGKLFLAPPGLNPKPDACESKNFPRRHCVS